MPLQQYFVKGMVCERCIASVKEALSDLPVKKINVTLGEVSFEASKTVNESVIDERLKALGFELLRDRRIQFVNDVKKLVEEVYSGNFDFPDNFRFFAFASERLNTTQNVISDAFKSVEGYTLERYVIDYRINQIKELLVYTDNSLSDIAFALGFNSVAHLSKQFKDNTGLNPSYFRQIKADKDSFSSDVSN